MGKKRAQNRVHPSAMRYASLVERSNDGIIIIEDGRLIYVNPRMTEMAGYSSDEVLGKPFLDFVSPDYRALIADRYRRRLAGENVPDRYEAGLLNKSGARIPIEVNSSLSKEGAKTVIIGIVQDISERKKAEEQLLASEASYRDLAESITDLFFALDKDLKYTYWNKASEELTGIPAKDAIGKNVYDLFPDNESTRRAAKLYQTVIRTGQPGRMVNEAHLYGKDFFFEINAYPTGDGLSVFVKDVTERRRIEEALHESEAKHRSLFENSFDAILLTIPDGRILSANAAACRMFGRSEQEICQVGRNGLLDLADPRLATALEERKRTGKFKGELTFVRKDGAKFTGELTSAVFLDNEGNPKTSMIISDITERKKTEETLRQNEEFLKNVIEQTPNPMWISDSQGTVIRMNQALRDLLKVTDEEIVGKYNVLNDQQIAKQGLAHLVESVFSEGKTVNFTIDYDTGKEKQLQLAEKTHLVLDIVISAIKGKDGKVINAICQHKDITEQEQAKEKLKASEQQYRTLIAASPDGVGIMGTNGRIGFVSQKMASLFGYEDESKLVGQSPLELTAPDDREKVSTNLGLTFMEGHSGPDQYRMLREDGSSFWGEVNSSIIKDKNGSPVAMIVTIRDITERKQAEEKLAEEMTRRVALFEQTPSGIVIIDPSTMCILEFNTVAHQRLGYTREEFAKLAIMDIEAKETAAETAAQIARVLKDGRVEFDTLHRTKQGKIRNIHVIAQTVNIAGEMIYQAIWQDITDQKNAQEKVLNSMKSTIAAMAMTTEMRDPYTAGHQERVTTLACAIAKEMGLPQDEIEGLRMAGIVHDIGKIRVPAEILAKPGSLTDLELSLIKIHPQAGYEVLKDIEFPWPIAQAVLQHHERLDGSGYPKGLKGDDIILEARILAVSDVVEAMASHRPFRAAIGIEQALEEISQLKGSLYDADVVDACLRLFKEKGFKFEI